MSLRYSREGWFGWPGERPNVGFWWLGTCSAPWHPGPCRPDSGHRPAAVLRPPELLGRDAVFCPESPFRQGKSPVSGLFSRDPRQRVKTAKGEWNG
jgi:hypothetical protein